MKLSKEQMNRLINLGIRSDKRKTVNDLLTADGQEGENNKKRIFGWTEC